MTHSLDTFQVDNGLVGQPSTFTYTCGAGTSVLVLGLVINANNARSGGAPTYNGVAMTQASTTQQSGQESGVEVWYLLAPPTGSAHTVSIPNTVGPRTINAVTSSWISATGTSALDVAAGAFATSTNPTTAISPLDGSLVIDRLSNGLPDVASVTESLTLLTEQDHGAFTSYVQYTLSASGITAVSWTANTDDWAHVVTAFKEVGAAAGWGMLLSDSRNKLVIR